MLKLKLHLNFARFDNKKKKQIQYIFESSNFGLGLSELGNHTGPWVNRGTSPVHDGREKNLTKRAHRHDLRKNHINHYMAVHTYNPRYAFKKCMGLRTTRKARLLGRYLLTQFYTAMADDKYFLEDDTFIVVTNLRLQNLHTFITIHIWYNIGPRQRAYSGLTVLISAFTIYHSPSMRSRVYQ